MRINKDENFARASLKDVVKFKVIFLFKLIWYCINKPLDTLLKWV